MGKVILVWLVFTFLREPAPGGRAARLAKLRKLRRRQGRS